MSWLIFGAQTSFNNSILSISQVFKVQICSPLPLSIVVLLVEDCMNSYLNLSEEQVDEQGRIRESLLLYFYWKIMFCIKRLFHFFSQVFKVQICSLLLLSRVVLFVEDSMNPYFKLKNKLMNREDT